MESVSRVNIPIPESVDVYLFLFPVVVSIRSKVKLAEDNLKYELPFSFIYVSRIQSN